MDATLATDFGREVACQNGIAANDLETPAVERQVLALMRQINELSLRVERDCDDPLLIGRSMLLDHGLSPKRDALIAPMRLSEAFAAYIRDVLIPEIESGTVVILDNLATQRNKEAEAALRAHGCRFLYLPPDRPDSNPIDMAFSKLKAHLRRIGARSFTGLFDALNEICGLYTPQDCWAYFCPAGYAST